jgi:hypothetical protein
MMEESEEWERVTFIMARPDMVRAQGFAVALDLSIEEYLRRALRIANAETEAFLSKFQK